MKSNQDLLEYYRERVGINQKDKFEKERLELLERIEKLKINQEENHNYEWEIKKQALEISDLQKQLNEANIKEYETEKKCLQIEES